MGWCRSLPLVVFGLRAMVYIALSCVSVVVLHSVLSSNNKVVDDDHYKISSGYGCSLRLEHLNLEMV